MRSSGEKTSKIPKSEAVFRIRSDPPLLLSFPNPAYSSEYYVNKLKIISPMYVHFFPLVTSSICCLYENFFQQCGVFKKCPC
jgi:hypothetical protein